VRRLFLTVLSFFCCCAPASSELLSTAQPNVHVLPAIAMPELGRSRILRIYLPPDYDAYPERRYPVIYMHDGQNLFDAKTSYAGEWGVDETLNEMAKSTGFEAIVVGIDHGGDLRLSELNPEVGSELKTAEGRQYLDFVVHEVKPLIDRTYRTLPDRDHTALMGSSLGGLITHYALQIHPDIFSKYGVFSPSYFAAPGLVAKAAEQPLPAGTRLYLYVGGLEARGKMAADATAMYEVLKPKGAVTYHLVPDANHNEAAWKSEFGPAVRWLFSVP
jgi:predicted alpha/beta superfamily hydrolase